MIRYRAVNRKHKMCGSNPPKGLHRRMKTFWLKHELGQCDGAILAYHKKELIGFFRFYKRKKGKTLYAGGTYVMKQYRGDGVAKNLWIKALKKTKPEIVDVMVASRGGLKLIKSLKKDFKKIEWIITRT
jgi:predicted GNAT family acetyltransferase